MSQNSFHRWTHSFLPLFCNENDSFIRRFASIFYHLSNYDFSLYLNILIMDRCFTPRSFVYTALFSTASVLYFANCVFTRNVTAANSRSAIRIYDLIVRDKMPCFEKWRVCKSVVRFSGPSRLEVRKLQSTFGNECKSTRVRVRRVGYLERVTGKQIEM